MLFEIAERRLLFQPRPVSEARPTDLGMDYEETWAGTPDGRKLQCWHIPGDTRPEITWLWFGGAGGNLSRRVGEFAAVRKHTGASIFGFDYRGFGNSPGKASVKGTAVDARVALEHLRSRYGVAPEGILYLGISLGAAVAIRLAAETSSPRGMALVAPFASLRELAGLIYPKLTWGGRMVGKGPLRLAGQGGADRVPVAGAAWVGRRAGAGRAGTQTVRGRRGNPRFSRRYRARATRTSETNPNSGMFCVAGWTPSLERKRRIKSADIDGSRRVFRLSLRAKRGNLVKECACRRDGLYEAPGLPLRCRFFTETTGQSKGPDGCRHAYCATGLIGLSSAPIAPSALQEGLMLWHSDPTSNGWRLKSSIVGIEATPDARPGWPARH